MHGNVWEWCEDGWHGNYEGAPVDGSAWTDNHSRTDILIVRGGSWYYGPGNCRSANRSFNHCGPRYGSLGLRLVCVSGFD
jgi:formylglycine-generating enzyme required for sulfatase activity